MVKPRRRSLLGGSGRSAFTITECLAALGMLGVGLTLLLQASFWNLRERSRASLRQEALESAANILEAARAEDWDALGPAWAERQRLPEALQAALPGSKLTVAIVTEAGNPATKQVTVQIALGETEPPVRLVGWFSRRSTGGKP